MGTMNAPSASGLPCPHQQSLTSLLTDVNAMRNLITCQICHNLMYEPFSLACGHTYCYSCLSQWLGHNKSCPDCRTRATQQPVPSYLVREMVLIFISRTQLLPDGETSEEHVKNAREEAGLVAQDRANTDKKTGGLFKGAFSQANTRLMPVHDPGDDVVRCPNCHWELEDLYCNHCNLDFDADWDGDDPGRSEGDDDSSDDEELDHDLDAVDQDIFGLDGVEHGIDGIENQYLAGAFLNSRGVQVGGTYRHGRQRHRGHQGVIGDEDDIDQSSVDEDSEGSLSGFINDDTIQIEQSSDSEEDESDGTVQEIASSNARGRRSRHGVDFHHGETVDTSAGATNGRSKTMFRPSQRLTIESESDSSGMSDQESDSEVEEDDEIGYSNQTHFPAEPTNRFSPIQYDTSTDGRSDVDTEDMLHNYEDPELDEQSDGEVSDDIDDADSINGFSEDEDELEAEDDDDESN
nr:putative ring finger protein [Quercus suber]